MDQHEKCYACGRAFRRNNFGQIVAHPEVLTIDGQRQPVGHDCYRHCEDGGEAGWQPPRGGPRLFCDLYAPAATLRAAGIVVIRK